MALKAVLGESPALTRAETALLSDWLDRLSGSHHVRDGDPIECFVGDERDDTVAVRVLVL